MTEPLDDSLEKLKAFCDLLRTTNPQLASGASELQQLAQTIDASETSLASDLDGLVTELDELHKEAESSEATVVKACQELGTAGPVEQCQLDDVSLSPPPRSLGACSGQR